MNSGLALLIYVTLLLGFAIFIGSSGALFIDEHMQHLNQSIETIDILRSNSNK